MNHRLRPPPSASAVPPPDFDRRSPWFARLPRKNFLRALFLVAALVGILLIRRAGGGFSALFEAFAPSTPPATPSYHLKVVPPSSPSP